MWSRQFCAWINLSRVLSLFLFLRIQHQSWSVLIHYSINSLKVKNSSISTYNNGTQILLNPDWCTKVCDITFFPTKPHPLPASEKNADENGDTPDETTQKVLTG